MRKNYDFSKAVKNPYAKRLKRELGPSATMKDAEDKSGVSSTASAKRKAVKATQRAAREREHQR